MFKIPKVRYLLFATLTSISLTQIVQAQETTSLTVVVNGIRHQKGEICFRVFADANGFPSGDTDGVASGCTKISGSYAKKEFSGLKPGRYAVAVIDDQNGDYKLDTDFFGIPQEGFGISNNPRVSISTGSPSFSKASFPIRKNTQIKINMKYSLDP
jgi:uncharacterized protein (DUF2141 family)